MNQADFIQFAIDNLKSNAILGGLLAIAILFVFLRTVASTLIIGVAIPISIITTFVVMYLSKLELNMMTLGGLALGIGMLVDNSIVVLKTSSAFVIMAMPYGKRRLRAVPKWGWRLQLPL